METGWKDSTTRGRVRLLKAHTDHHQTNKTPRRRAAGMKSQRGCECHQGLKRSVEFHMETWGASDRVILSRHEGLGGLWPVCTGTGEWEGS